MGRPKIKVGDPLTHKQTEVMTHVSNGKTFEEVGMIMGVATSTVKGQMRLIKKKLDADRVTYAVKQFQTKYKPGGT